MVSQDLSFDTLAGVVESWEHIRRLPNFPEKAGVMLFQRLFEIEPEAKELFGFKKDDKVDDLLETEIFIRHAKFFVLMFDKAIEMMGPDLELLTDILMELGAKHYTIGVKPQYFSAMGPALISVLKALLDEEIFSSKVAQSWHEVFGAISYDMIRGQQKIKEMLI